jgi:hypothetical protein
MTRVRRGAWTTWAHTARPISIAVSVVLAAAGCSTTVRLYPGPKRPDAHVSVIELDRVIVLAVDGLKVETWHARFEILPGTHAIALERDRTIRVVCLDARAGHVYLARAQRSDRVWFPEIVDTNTASVVVTGTTSADAPDCSSEPMGSKANAESHAP